MIAKMIGIVLATTAWLLVSGAASADPPTSKRLPVPDAAARETALATVRELFKTDIDKAKTPEEQAALLAKMTKTADETKDDLVGRFVLWQLTVETATKQGDIKAAFAALDEVARDYEVDELNAKSKTFVGLVHKSTIKNFPDVLALASVLVGRAVGADRYDIAKAVSEPLNAVAQKFGDSATKKDLNVQLAEVRRLEKAYADEAAALKALEGNPTNPAANLTAGKYQMEKGNWEAALSYLALSDDSQFKDIAAKELAQPTDVGERIAIADEWWKLGEADKTLLKTQLQAHATDLYTVSLSDATGLTKKKIETRLAEAAKLPKSPLDLHFTPGANNGGKVAKNVTNSIGLKLNLIPAGEFDMGSPETETRSPTSIHDQGEKQHHVKITKPFYMGIAPVMRGQFAQFVTAEKYLTDAEKASLARASATIKTTTYSWREPGTLAIPQTDEHPVVYVTWNDSIAFCDWLSKKENKKYRLPTEAEWEYACRAGTKTAYSFGDWLNGTQANCNGNYPYPSGTAPRGTYVGGTTKPGAYKPNAAGLFDMHGNVAQWCQDYFSPVYYANSPAEDPTGPTNAPVRVLRGGSWNANPMNCRSASREGVPPNYPTRYIGFRVVLDLPEIPKPAAHAATPAPTAMKFGATPTPMETPIPPPEQGGKLQFKKWTYAADERGRAGYFEMDADGWKEMKEGELFGRFKEIDRTPDYIEIKDDTRNLWVRMTSKQATWSKDHEKWYVSAQGSPAENK